MVPTTTSTPAFARRLQRQRAADRALLHFAAANRRLHRHHGTASAVSMAPRFAVQVLPCPRPGCKSSGCPISAVVRGYEPGNKKATCRVCGACYAKPTPQQEQQYRSHLASPFAKPVGSTASSHTPKGNGKGKQARSKASEAPGAPTHRNEDLAIIKQLIAENKQLHNENNKLLQQHNKDGQDEDGADEEPTHHQLLADKQKYLEHTKKARPHDKALLQAIEAECEQLRLQIKQAKPLPTRQAQVSRKLEQTRKRHKELTEQRDTEQAAVRRADGTLRV